MRVRDIQRCLEVDTHTARTVSRLVHGKAHPCEVSTVCDRWVSRCILYPDIHEQILCAINQLIGGYGIEALWEDDEKRWSCDRPDSLYVNTGDTYTATVLWDRERGYQLTTIGDWMEERERERTTEWEAML